MKKTFTGALLACAVLAAGLSIQRASAQDATPYPGQPTRANVWIQNRGDVEAVPVSLENIATELPLRVEISGIPRMTLDPANVLQVRVAPRVWAYRTVTIAAGQDPVGVLNREGADGWETTGLALPSAGGTLIILKRPN